MRRGHTCIQITSRGLLINSARNGTWLLLRNSRTHSSASQTDRYFSYSGQKWTEVTDKAANQYVNVSNVTHLYTSTDTNHKLCLHLSDVKNSVLCWEAEIILFQTRQFVVAHFLHYLLFKGCITYIFSDPYFSSQTHREQPCMIKYPQKSNLHRSPENSIPATSSRNAVLVSY